MSELSYVVLALVVVEVNGNRILKILMSELSYVVYEGVSTT